ncbi:hypothetical protein KI387_038590, partial [Taxus chinensis]
LQSDYGKGGRPVQDSLHNQMGHICLQEDAIWTVERRSNIPASYGYGIQRLDQQDST